MQRIQSIAEEHAMSTTTQITPAEGTTLGKVSEHYASALLTAVVRAGAPGRVVRGHYREGSESAQEASYTRWSFLGLHLRGRDVRVFCVPTSTGVVLFVGTVGGTCRCLPTYGAPASEFGAATLAVARQTTTMPADDEDER